MSLSSAYGPSEDEEGLAAIETALEREINFLDSAEAYGGGHNERLAAQVLHERRDRVVMATKWGGECFAGAGNTAELGEIKKGYLADLVMIDGDPLDDITLLQDRDNFLMIMKDGAYHKPPEPRRAVPGRIAAAE